MTQQEWYQQEYEWEQIRNDFMRSVDRLVEFLEHEDFFRQLGTDAVDGTHPDAEVSPSSGTDSGRTS